MSEVTVLIANLTQLSLAIR